MPGETQTRSRVVDGLRATVAGAGRRVLLAGILLLGVAVAVLAAFVLPAVSAAVLAAPAQLAMSVLLPLSGVLLAHDLFDDPGPELPVLLAAVAYAVVVAVVGTLVCLVVATLTPGARIGPIVSVLLGGIAVQVTAQLVGTGLGFLARQRLVAFLGTIALPLGVWVVLRLLGTPDWVQQSLTPVGAAAQLVSGAPTLSDWVGWVLVLVLWGVLLNVLGIAVRRRRLTGPA